MKKLLLLFISLLLLSYSSATQKLVVHLLSGEKVFFALDDQPVTSFDGDNLVITTNSTQITYRLADMRWYTYEGIDGNVGNGLESPTLAPGDISVRHNDNLMAIDGLNDNEQVMLYSADGRLMSQQTAKHKQTTYISLIGYPSGAYIVAAGKATYKFVKR